MTIRAKIEITALMLAALLAFTGCVSIPSQNVSLAYTSDLDPFEKTGTGSLSGQAFLRQQGGGVVVCAGEDVRLLPYAGVFKQAFDLAKSGIRPVVLDHEKERFTVAASANPRFSSVVRDTKCNAQGNFSFSALPAGKWIVSTSVSWIVADVQQGSALSTVVEIQPNEMTNVLLTDSDRL